MPECESRYVEVCVFRFRRDAAEFLMLRRADGEKVYPGMWQFVTGKVRSGETAAAAARRELREETSLEPLRFWVVPHCSTFYDPVRDAVQIVPMFAVQADADAAPRLSPEHSAWNWVDAAEAQRRLVWPGQRAGLAVVAASILGGEPAGLLGLLPGSNG